MNDDLIISVVNKMSTLLGKIQEADISMVIYQILLLTNPSVARVVLISVLLNIRKKCTASQLPSVINHFAFALRNNAVSLIAFFQLVTLQSVYGANEKHRASLHHAFSEYSALSI